MTGFVEQLGNNFVVATFIPSLGFFVIATILLKPVLPDELSSQLTVNLSSPLIGTSVILFVFSLLLGFTLMALNSFIYKLTEGYFIFHKLAFWRKRQHERAYFRRRQIIATEKILQLLIKRITPTNQSQVLEMIAILRQKQTQLKASYRLDYPQHRKNILPTRFGNILRAAESYPNEQYGIDGVVMWPRLLYVIAPNYIARLEQSNNGLAFIVNSMVLSFALAILCLGISASQFYLWYSAKESFENQNTAYFVEMGKWPDEEAIEEFNPVNPLYFIVIDVTLASQRKYYELGWLYLIGTLMFVGLSYVFYNASLPAARQYGGLIRSAYDLFRFDLAKQLKLPRAKDWNDEKDNWLIWSEYVLIGRQKNLKPFSYEYDDKAKSSSSNEESGAG